MDRRTYKAFTLIEMLIVMGILVILMVVGIAAGRFATQRAQDIAHQNGVTNIYQGLAAYFTDEGEYPMSEDSTALTPADLMGEDGVLSEYIDLASFDGGINTTYYYYVANAGQSVIVCVALGGEDDEAGRGIYCDGNGFNDSQLETYNALKKGKNEKGETTGIYETVITDTDGHGANWDGTDNGWE